MSLECREHLGSVSPGPQSAQASCKQPAASSPSLAIGIKRERAAESSQSAKRKRSDPPAELRVGYAEENYPSSPLHSLASVAVAAATASNTLLSPSPAVLLAPKQSRGFTNKTHIANIWVPPKVDHIEVRRVFVSAR